MSLDREQVTMSITILSFAGGLPGKLENGDIGLRRHGNTDTSCDLPGLQKGRLVFRWSAAV
ncbi:MAG: hypothetical protein IJ325_12145 [Clostridia bacterium]|nr:hypothetical protein [Clostridia bacterium]